jgi:hypothetical protein
VVVVDGVVVVVVGEVVDDRVGVVDDVLVDGPPPSPPCESWRRP